MEQFEKLLHIAQRKSIIDQNSDWSNGSSTYLEEIKKEVEEVLEEIPKNRDCYLEDELGDILWDYMNILLAMEKERGIKLTAVLERACKKYEERILGIESGKSWAEVKEKQKIDLAEELDLEKSKSS
ncbi:MazG nucleotide pyrophosphohydrolase domain-containing protein [Sediminitomix flava]|uniref:NTP pyrophosphatase (Non-canonical NTP hydrolase) n=1 Tax=Sediminitomix flava TaxID=379075 RepID=A0A315ZBQ3_SEDFL|nr:MazG nucleotide pyrophosphohydrolase domain-containing protein [Sediminitomix flava]PWJ43006.1 NTP pyrophosphatase (non-canonical NTP hydrolase) [Sediminitomix flava]